MLCVFLKALPGISVAMRGCWGPFEDTEGLSSHFDGAAGRLAGVKKIKRIRVDLLTSCEGAPRSHGLQAPVHGRTRSGRACSSRPSMAVGR